ncbi:hypothetical protein [Bacillus licheniformis]|uniref:DUF4376 domain-containing protein n=1 Tax=Bacillus licheniformis TaxID=1402 RepID=UPI0008FB1F9A|nr:hypothetical protein [Bacillus licheniformis]OIS74608.1 hypothetical protein A4A40_18720 [Bacillus licheniformis]OIS80633.1 hypothetical protein A4A43_09505 [Bacillus licheniformis]OIS82216.1 hypothetical protein A4A38_05470 [Bacillus licheniformis]OIS89991.1 hypothetical protein A4A42_00215 [Bacillus licheniformis]TWK91130.1 hypothetical protein CHCC20327_2507 [Bacillus licheniformis]
MNIYISLNEKGQVTGWGSTRGMDSEIEIDIEDNDPFLTDNPFIYRYLDGKLVKDESFELNRAKSEKIEELSRECKAAILGRFVATVDGVEYLFSCDIEAQANFEKAEKSFAKGLITEIPWTAYDSNGKVVRVLLNQEKFEPVYIKHLEHIQNNISKFRDFLQPMVEDAQTPEEVFIIRW